MIKQLSSIILLFLAITLSGCDNSQKTVILDLDAIANATGQAATIKQQIEMANQELNAQLKTISIQLNEQLESEKKKMGPQKSGKNISKNDKQNMEQLTLQANKQMQQAKAIANQKSQQYRASLVQKLRQQVSPIAETIARDRGADIVVIATSTMMWFNPDIDITDEVIAEMRANAAKAPVVVEDKAPAPAAETEKEEESK